MFELSTSTTKRPCCSRTTSSAWVPMEPVEPRMAMWRGLKDTGNPCTLTWTTKLTLFTPLCSGHSQNSGSGNSGRLYIGEMKYLFCSITLCIAVLSAAAQAPFSSWYAISYESPAYIPTFEKVDLLTGNRVLSSTPYAGYFQRCISSSRPGRYVVQLQDSLQDNHRRDRYERHRCTKYVHRQRPRYPDQIHPAFVQLNFYYGLRLSSTAPGYEFFSAQSAPEA